MTKIAVVYHSATGRTKTLAEAVARGASSAAAAPARGGSVVTHLLDVEEAARSHDLLAAADAIVFGCPTYMGSASGAFKTFMDATSTVWTMQGWKDKLAAGFTHSAAPSGDKLGTLMQLAIFAAQHGMIWVGLGLPPTYATVGDPTDDVNRLGSHLGAMAQSRPGGGVLPEGDVATAEVLGRRVAEACRRWGKTAKTSREQGTGSREQGSGAREMAARGWELPETRPRPGNGIDRINLREVASRAGRFEHHFMVCATVDGVELEVTTGSEPLYFGHVNLSDEYALALPTGDELVDRYPLRTLLSDVESGEDVGRYNHRVGDLVLHPEGLLHWPGRLKAPYEAIEFPPGARRASLGLVYCASKVTPPTWCPLPPLKGREADVQALSTPPPPMILAAMRGEPGPVGRIGRTTLTLLVLPEKIAPAHGGWVVVLETTKDSLHAPCDLVRIARGASLDGAGIVRAILVASDEKEPDAPPHLWTELPTPLIPPYEDDAPGTLPLEIQGSGGSLTVHEDSAALVLVSVGGLTAKVPRHWLARTLYRVALHKVRFGYVETYEGFFVDDRGDRVRIGLHVGKRRASVEVGRAEALAVIERLYRAVAPPGYRERPA